MLTYILTAAVLIFVTAVLALSRLAIKAGPKALLGLAAVVTALGTLATALLAYAHLT